MTKRIIIAFLSAFIFVACNKTAMAEVPVTKNVKNVTPKSRSSKLLDELELLLIDYSKQKKALAEKWNEGAEINMSNFAEFERDSSKLEKSQNKILASMEKFTDSDFSMEEYQRFEKMVIKYGPK